MAKSIIKANSPFAREIEKYIKSGAGKIFLKSL